jgi:hypothetical protein
MKLVKHFVMLKNKKFERNMWKKIIISKMGLLSWDRHEKGTKPIFFETGLLSSLFLFSILAHVA